MSNTYVKPRTRLARRLLLIAGVFAALAGAAGWYSAMSAGPLIVEAAPEVAEGEPFQVEMEYRFAAAVESALVAGGYTVADGAGSGGWSSEQIEAAVAGVLAGPGVERLLGQALQESWRDGQLTDTTRTQVGRLVVDAAIAAQVPTKLTDELAQNPPTVDFGDLGLPDTAGNARYTLAAVALGAAAVALAAVALLYADHRGLAAIRLGKTMVGVAVANAAIVCVYGWMILPGRQNLSGDALGALVRGVAVYVLGAALLVCAFGGLTWWVGARITASRPWLSDEARVRVRDWGDEGDANASTASLWVLRSHELGELDED